ncbi:MAG: MBL fold metallo-hydrolase, partial [Spirochaetota bacterium]
MKKALLSALLISAGAAGFAGGKMEKDIIPTSAGNLEITFIGHSSLMLTFAGMNIFTDPCGEFADYSAFPKADIVLVTHEHFDHFDAKALAHILSGSTDLILTEDCFRSL